LKDLLFKILESGIKPVNKYHAIEYIVKLFYTYKGTRAPGFHEPGEIEKPIYVISKHMYNK
jgi:hypothetical protein